MQGCNHAAQVKAMVDILSDQHCCTERWPATWTISCCLIHTVVILCHWLLKLLRSWEQKCNKSLVVTWVSVNLLMCGIQQTSEVSFSWLLAGMKMEAELFVKATRPSSRLCIEISRSHELGNTAGSWIKSVNIFTGRFWIKLMNISFTCNWMFQLCWLSFAIINERIIQ